MHHAKAEAVSCRQGGGPGGGQTPHPDAQHRSERSVSVICSLQFSTDRWRRQHMGRPCQNECRLAGRSLDAHLHMSTAGRDGDADAFRSRRPWHKAAMKYLFLRTLLGNQSNGHELSWMTNSSSTRRGTIAALWMLWHKLAHTPGFPPRSPLPTPRIVNWSNQPRFLTPAALQRRRTRPPHLAGGLWEPRSGPALP